MVKKVLVVEENALNQRLFNDALAADGFDIVTSSGREDVVACVKRAQPDLIVMEMCLPEVDGMEATRRLKCDDITLDIPVIAVTSCALAGDREAIMGGGCSAYFPKPVAVDDFVACVRSYLQ